MKAWIATAAGILALVGTVFGGVEILDSRYVASSELQSLSIEIFYREYREAQKDLQKAKEARNAEAIADIEFRLERLRGKICAIEPQWPRCKD